MRRDACAVTAMLAGFKFTALATSCDKRLSGVCDRPGRLRRVRMPLRSRRRHRLHAYNVVLLEDPPAAVEPTDDRGRPRCRTGGRRGSHRDRIPEIPAAGLA
jgi:hypothetical protein